jgi:deoxycytidylate deaminase
MIENKPKRLIILGLTGPVGSGCTEFSKIFDDDKNANRSVKENKLLNYLSGENKFIEIDRIAKKIHVKHDSIDEIISRLFAKINNLDDLIKETKERIKKEDEKYILSEDIDSIPLTDGKLDINEVNKKAYLFKLKRKLFNKLKDSLEKRETLKSLNELKEFIDFETDQHHFRRISISDLIIYYALVFINTITKKIAKKKEIERFLKILQQDDIKLKISEILDDIRKLKLRAKNLGALILYLHKRNKGVDENKIIELLSKTIDLIRVIKEKLQKETEIYRTLMQDFGDNIRKTGNPYRDIKNNQVESIKEQEHHLSLAKDVSALIDFLYEKRNHSFFVIDTFRNPYEALYFKEKYTNFYLVSLYASKEQRQIRIKRKYGYFDEIGERRDQGKAIQKPIDNFYMQNVPKTVKFSDIAINNEKDLINDKQKFDDNKLIEKAIRYLALIFDPGCTKPTDDEVMMNLAFTMAMKSNCISRQVGAVIVGREGYVVGAGWNDVGEGKISCGLREIKDLALKWYRSRYSAILKITKDENDQDVIDRLVEQYIEDAGLDKDTLQKFCFCFKDEISKIKLNDKIEKIFSVNELSLDCKESLQKTLDIKRLEFCEALHAEENAIIQSSKIGGMGVKGGKIYTTAFPCELCSKKIQQVGISEVIYTEPYPGNISEPIYLHNAFDKIKIRQFEGVMPHSYFKLFKVVDDQKDWQEMYSKGLVE